MEAEKTFYLEKSLDRKEKETYAELLRESLDVFAWLSLDLKEIFPDLGKHQIDLVERAVPVQ